MFRARCSGSISRTVLVDAELVGVDDAGADRRHDRRQEVEVDFLAPPSLSRWYSAIDTAAAPATPAIESARPKAGRRRPVRLSVEVGEATHRLDEGAEGRAGGIGAALPEAGDPQQDQTRVVSGEDVVAEPQRSRVPGRKFSTMTSAVRASCLKIRAPSGSPR